MPWIRRESAGSQRRRWHCPLRRAGRPAGLALLRHSRMACSRVSSRRRFSSGTGSPGSSSPRVTSSPWFRRVQRVGRKCSTWRPSLSQPSRGVSGGRQFDHVHGRLRRLPVPSPVGRPCGRPPWQRWVRCSPWAINPWCSWQVSTGMQFTPAVVPEPVASHADLAAAAGQQRALIEVRPFVNGLRPAGRRTRRRNGGDGGP